MKNNILVLGSSGFLGSNFMDYGKDKSNYFFASSTDTSQRNKLIFFTDYSNETLIKYCVQNQISTIVNCVGFTDIEKTEIDSELNQKLNYDFPLRISDLCEVNAIKFVHFSTDHFESEIKTPRFENSKIYAINKYAETKLKAEQILISKDNILIIRTNFFGYNRTSNSKLFDWAVGRLEQDLTIEGFIDVYFTPISVSMLVEITNDLISMDAKGIVNVVGSESITKYYFLSQLALNLGINDNLVKPISIDNSVLKIKRTNYLSLSNKILLKLIPDKYNFDLNKMIAIEVARHAASRAGFTSETTPN